MKRTLKAKEEGMVLLEAIVAVGVLTTMFAATMALFTASVTGVNLTNDQLIATYLAQDAMEQIIAKNQYNFDNGEDWLFDMNNCSLAGGCALDYFSADVDTSPEKCVDANNCKLYFESGVYTTTGINESPYTRVTTISLDALNHQAVVEVEVSWLSGEDTLTYTLRNILYEYLQ